MLAIALAIAATNAILASATSLPPSSDPLPGSSFQGADGDQDDAGSLMDWEARQAAGRVTHNPDPNAQDSAFTGGNKETQPGDWQLTTEAGGVVPGKSNIRAAWSVLDQPGADTFLQLGFTRDGPRGLRSSRSSSTTTHAVGQRPSAHPCRRTGDLLISYDAQGNDVDVAIRRWTRDARSR